MSAARADGRAAGDLRPISIEPGFVSTAAGSALIACGGTRVICTASVVEDVPRWMAGRGRGWVTAEYGMLPASTGERKQRDAARGRLDGRTVEIQRLIGRSLRGVVDFKALGERTLYVDCDVLEADGGTRCAAVTGGYVALQLALEALLAAGRLTALPLTQSIAAVSCGVVDGRALLDLDYREDSSAEVDANVVMTGDGGLAMSDQTDAEGLRERLTRTSEDALGKLAQDLLENPLVHGALARAFDAREKAAQAQEVAFGALNIPSASDLERLTVSVWPGVATASTAIRPTVIDWPGTTGVRRARLLLATRWPRHDGGGRAGCDHGV